MHTGKIGILHLVSMQMSIKIKPIVPTAQRLSDAFSALCSKAPAEQGGRTKEAPLTRRRRNALARDLEIPENGQTHHNQLHKPSGRDCHCVLRVVFVHFESSAGRVSLSVVSSTPPEIHNQEQAYICTEPFSAQIPRICPCHVRCYCWRQYLYHPIFLITCKNQF